MTMGTSKPVVPRNSLQLMYRMYKYVLPEVNLALDGWRQQAEHIPDPELRKQAIASITTKQFHCQGGAVYAIANLSQRQVLIPLIVAFQTISDYLDNLCDRSTSLDPLDFRQLHQSMLDAIDPDAPLHDYYAYRDEREDGDYLKCLVETCQSCIRQLPAYDQVSGHVRELVGLYCDLQVYKHIRHDQREPQLLDWWAQYEDQHPSLQWNEFAAATGSTLGMFMLFVSASDQAMPAALADEIKQTYFPYICALHILLDYLIDQEEDRAGGDLNFCHYYGSVEQTFERIDWIASQSRLVADQLPSNFFHLMIIEGLLALYLSDPKVSKQQKVKHITRKLMKNSPFMRLFFWLNSKWIRKVYTR